MRRFYWLIFALALVSAGRASAAAHTGPTKTENVFLIISDGLRWQEVFQGADETLMNKTNGGVKNVATLQTNFWRATPELRRTALFPFFWGEVARRGQLYGNQTKGSLASVTNGRKFSYPGYNEMLAGFGDPKIDSNDKKPNLNLTVFEWLHRQSRFEKRVAVFGPWDAFPFIFNCERSGLPIWPPWETRFDTKTIVPPVALQSVLNDTTPVFEGVIQDSFLFHAALDHIQRRKPRLAFIGCGETDEWAHAGRYDQYLEAAHRVDRYVARLWDTVQQMPQYRGKTTFIISTDHGRGGGLSDWKDHGEKTDGAEGIWLAVIGPDTPAWGERFHTQPITQSQIAATIGALVGQDFQAAAPGAAAPLPEVLGFAGGSAVQENKLPIR